MNRRLPFGRGLLLVFLALTPATAGEQAGTAVTVKPIPSLADVQQTVRRYFQGRRDFQSSDLITSDVVAPLLAELQRKGLPLADASEILEAVPAKDDFLVQQLCTPAGRKFMRRISSYPNVYERLDRLASLPHGPQTVQGLIRNPGGENMVAYMTTTVSGERLGKVLTNRPEAELFTVPTGRIYTVPILLTRLQQSREAALKAAGKKNSP
jgi:hypothetical protein